MTMLNRWHASVIGGNDRRTAVCTHTEIAAVTWLCNRMYEAQSALGEEKDKAAIAALDLGMAEAWNSKPGETKFTHSVGGETYVIERRFAVGNLGHDSCEDFTIDRWASWAASRAGSGSRWKCWPEVGYRTVS